MLRRPPSLDAVCGAIVAFLSLLIGLGPLNDNSFLTHLATGRIMWDSHHVPLSDPYTFTAGGHSWVVQSWLASLLYGACDRLWGAPGVLLLVGVTATAVGLLAWTLTRPAGSPLTRLLIMAPVVIVGADAGWVERPLLFGLVALGLVLLSAEGRLDPRWLVLVMWCWVNVHGSFPLGLLALGLLALGRRLDGASPAVELRALKWAAVGAVLGGVNPIGPRVLFFPLELLQRQDVLTASVREWQAPLFTRIGQRAFLVEVVLAVIVLARRPSWRASLPLAVFTAAALVGSRNVVVASMVMIPGLAVGLSGIGTVAGDERRGIFRPIIATIAAVSVLSAVVAASGPVYSYNGYPIAAVEFAERQHLFDGGAHVVAQDFVGNYLEARDGRGRRVFFDDRYDLFPTRLIEDVSDLKDGKPGWDAILDRYEASAVIWPIEEPLAQLLAISPRWRVIYSDQEFLIAQRR